jgi:hypothetical protein
MAKKPYHGKIPTMVKSPPRNKIWVVLKPLYIYIGLKLPSHIGVGYEYE